MPPLIEVSDLSVEPGDGSAVVSWEVPVSGDIHGFRVLGTTEDLPRLVKELGIVQVVITIAFTVELPLHVNVDLLTVRPLAQAAQHKVFRGKLFG